MIHLPTREGIRVSLCACRELSSELAAKEGRVQELLTSVARLQEENARLWDEAQQGLSLADNMAELHQHFQVATRHHLECVIFMPARVCCKRIPTIVAAEKQHVSTRHNIGHAERGSCMCILICCNAEGSPVLVYPEKLLWHEEKIKAYDPLLVCTRKSWTTSPG